MNFRSIATLNDQVLQWIPRLPRDLELIVGIPRSGMLVGNLLALYLNIPLTDLEGFRSGRVFIPGERCRLERSEEYLAQRRKVLVVDDSVLYGTQMKQVREQLRPLSDRHRLHFAAVYMQPGQEKLVDFYCELLPRPRLFEWHLMHHPNLRHWCVDIDGVLCDDPTVAENDDGENYQRFLDEVPPKLIPSKEIGWLVTCRLEKYRLQTERWLARHGVRHRHLLMMDHPDMASRKAAGGHARHKAAIYRKTGAPLFIESCPRQAVEIARLSGKSVFCYGTREMINPGIFSRTLRQPGKMLEDLLQPPKLEIKRMVQNLLKS